MPLLTVDPTAHHRLVRALTHTHDHAHSHLERVDRDMRLRPHTLHGMSHTATAFAWAWSIDVVMQSLIVAPALQRTAQIGDSVG